MRSLGLTLLLIGAFSISAKAQSSFIMTLEQDGSDVVGTGSGTIGLDGLSYVEDLTTTTDELIPDGSTINFGTPASGATFYDGLTGPGSFGTGGNTSATTGSGDPVAIVYPIILVPQGYVSGTSLSDTATWDSTTLADLGVTPGVYRWTWGTDNENSAVLYAGVPVPEPCRYGGGVLLATLGLFAWRRFSPRPAVAR
jgi:hypothetical protein